MRNIKIMLMVMVGVVYCLSSAVAQETSKATSSSPKVMSQYNASSAASNNAVVANKAATEELQRSITPRDAASNTSASFETHVPVPVLNVLPPVITLPPIDTRPAKIKPGPIKKAPKAPIKKPKIVK